MIAVKRIKGPQFSVTNILSTCICTEYNECVQEINTVIFPCDTCDCVGIIIRKTSVSKHIMFKFLCLKIFCPR